MSCRPVTQPRFRLALQLALVFVATAIQSAHGESVPAPVPVPAPAPAGPYVRLGGGIDWPESTDFADANCGSKQPAALFGCGVGNNGRPLGASGSFDPAVVVDGALGYRFNRWIRAEALLSWRPDLNFNGQSNFVGAAGPNQPVGGSVQSVAGFGVAYVDLPRVGKVRPFLGAGIGVARNRIDSLNFSFPGLPGDATTTTPGGSSSNLAYLLTAGLSVPLSAQLDLELAYRFSDLGRIQTGSGNAQVVRAAGTFNIPIGGTTADLQTHGLLMSLRYAF